MLVIVIRPTRPHGSERTRCVRGAFLWTDIRQRSRYLVTDLHTYHEISGGVRGYALQRFQVDGDSVRVVLVGIAGVTCFNDRLPAETTIGSQEPFGVQRQAFDASGPVRHANADAHVPGYQA